MSSSGGDVASAADLASIPFSSIYLMQARTVHGLFTAMDEDLLPDEPTELVFGMSSTGDQRRLLYGAFQTLRGRGRLSRTMLEQAMCYSPTSYRESVTLWIQSLPPGQRSQYTALLCKSKFKNLPWDTDPKFPNYFNQMGTLGSEELDDDNNNDTLLKRIKCKPLVPLGDNRHDPRTAKAVRLAKEFYNLFTLGLIFQGPEAPPNLNNCDPESLSVLRNCGSLFGIDSPELAWEEGNLRMMPEVMTVSEMMLRTWNSLYYNQRLSLTELECALMQGNMREFMTQAVEVTYQGQEFAKHGRSMLRSALGFLKGDSSSLRGDTAPEDFQLVFTNLNDGNGNNTGDDPSLLECDHCGTELETTKRCSKCWTAMYCSGDCQKKDWSRHKPLCSRYTGTPPSS